MSEKDHCLCCYWNNELEFPPQELSALKCVLGLNGPGLAVKDKVWALVPLNGRPIEVLNMLPIGLRTGYRKQRSWLSH